MNDPAQAVKPAVGGFGLPPAPELGLEYEEPINPAPAAGLPQLASLYEPISNQPPAAVPAWLTPSAPIKPVEYPQVVQNQASPPPLEAATTPTKIAGQFTTTPNLPGIYYPVKPATETAPLIAPQPVVVNIYKPAPTQVTAVPTTVKPPLKPVMTVPPAAAVIPPPQTMGGTIISAQETAPVLARGLSLIYLLMGGFYLLISLGLLLIGYQFNRFLLEGQALAFAFLKEAPLLGALPLMLLLAAIASFWASVYLKESSRTGWVLGVMVALGAPIMVGMTRRLMSVQLEPLTNLATANLNLPANLINFLIKGIFVYQYAFLALAILTAVCFSWFRSTGSYNNRNSKAMVSLFTFFSIFIIGGLLGGAYAFAFSDNYAFSAVEEQVSFNLYKPKAIPGGRTYKTQYRINQGEGMLNGRTDFVQVTFDYPLGQQSQRGGPSPIILRQVDVPPGFATAQFASGLLTGMASPAAVLVPGATQDTAYTLETINSKGALRAVMYTTRVNVLIFISSTKASLNDLITLANNLE
ncbi:hypothetical protein A2W24_03015 [Microgenomates group bacterium RBG_16_45_19]|nr:MAG: hypothetical protein A2W24_03015 [Microgenomates group bacterium RBG_16_45_19]